VVSKIGRKTILSESDEEETNMKYCAEECLKLL